MWAKENFAVHPSQQKLFSFIHLLTGPTSENFFVILAFGNNFMLSTKLILLARFCTIILAVSRQHSNPIII